LHDAVTEPEASEPVTLKNEADTLERSRAEKSSRAAEQLLARRTVIKERFLLEELLGFGGMGTVYKARDLRKVEAQDHEPWVAIKLLNEDFKAHPNSQNALQAEVKKTQALAHPNIVQVYDFDRDGDVVFMTMEFMQGQDLNNYIQQHAQGVPLDEVLLITRGMGAALQHAHDNQIIHSDLTPKNVFLTTDGKTKVLDFGIAQAIAHVDLETSDSELTVFEAVNLAGMTPGYAGQERLQGMTPEASDDVFALGCIVYQLLSGAHPYKGRSAMEAATWRIRPEKISGLSTRQWRALQKAMALSRADRLQTVQEFLDDFCPPAPRLTKSSAGAALVAALIIGVVGYQIFANYLGELQRRHQQLDDRRLELEEGEAQKEKQTKLEQEQITKEYLALVEALIAKDQYDEAKLYLDRVRDSAPGHHALDVLQRKLDESRESHRQRQLALANRERDIERLLDAADAYIANGKLVQGEASAYSMYLQLQALDPDGLQARALLQRLVQLHLDGLDRALHSGDLRGAESWLEDLVRIAPDNRNLARLRAELNQALAQREERTRQVTALLAQANRLTGESSATERRGIYIKVLEIAPANKAALAGMEAADADIARAEQRRMEQARADAEALLLQAQRLLGKRPATPENFRQAREFLLQSMQHSPDFQAAAALLEQMPEHYIEAIEGLMADKDYPEAGSMLDAAMAMTPRDTGLVELRKELDAVIVEGKIVVPTSF
jgi:serine/threonine protein kinase